MLHVVKLLYVFINLSPEKVFFFKKLVLSLLNVIVNVIENANPSKLLILVTNLKQV